MKLLIFLNFLNLDNFLDYEYSFNATFRGLKTILLYCGCCIWRNPIDNTKPANPPLYLGLGFPYFFLFPGRFRILDFCISQET